MPTKGCRAEDEEEKGGRPQEQRNSSCSPNIVTVIKSRKMSWEGVQSEQKKWIPNFDQKT
jgi:hypothetical protein